MGLSSNSGSHIFPFLSCFSDISMAAYSNGLSAFLTNSFSKECVVQNARYCKKQETDLYVLICFEVVFIPLCEMGRTMMCNNNNEKKTNKTAYSLSMWPGLTVRVLTHM